jgi:heme-degrading monooxygenase HmoA
LNVIARIWRGWTLASDAEEYARYGMETGIKGYRNTPGNRGAFILRRPQGTRTEFITLSFWDSLDSVRKFAGDQVERAVFYPEDDRFLVDRETTVSHFEVLDAGELRGSVPTASREERA